MITHKANVENFEHVTWSDVVSTNKQTKVQRVLTSGSSKSGCILM